MLALGGGAAALYAATLCRSLYFYDSAEYATVAHNLGVPHPPGYPLYTLLAHLFVRFVPGSVAFAVNVLSAVSAVVAVLLGYAVARTLGARAPFAAVSGALLGSAPAFWLNATVAEVYAPGLCGALCVVLVLLRARATDDARQLLVASGLAGLFLGLHYSLATLGLGLAWLALEATWRSHGRGKAARLGGVCGVVALLGFSLNLGWLVLRAPAMVTPNHAHPPSFARLLWLVSGGNYSRWFDAEGSLLERVAGVLASVTTELSLAGLVLSVVGAVALARRSPSEALGLGLAIAGNLAFFVRYRVHDLEVFLLPAVALLCIAAGLGLQALLDGLLALRATAWSAREPWRFLLLAGVAAALLAPRVTSQYRARDLSDFGEAEQYGERLCAQLPYSAVILNYTTPEEWKLDAVFGLYFQHVLGRRRDVIVVKNVDRPVLDRLLLEGRAVFLYAPVAHVLREYVLVPDGALFRVSSRR
jgi:hypothetical protein